MAARRIQRLQALSEQISQEFPEVKIHCDVVDVRDKSAVEAFMSRIPDNLCEIDVLVNNAGMVTNSTINSRDRNGRRGGQSGRCYKRSSILDD